MVSCWNKVIIITLLILSVLVWFVPRLITYCRKKQNGVLLDTEPQVKDNQLWKYSLCLLGAVWCLRFAVGYYAIFDPFNEEETLFVWEEIFNSFVHALQTFSMDEDYTEYIHDGKEMMSVGLGLGDVGQVVYGIYASILNMLAPIAGGAVVLELLAKIFPEFWLWLSFFGMKGKKYYFFSELNEASLALAKSILKEKDEKRPVLVFTDVYIDDEKEKDNELLLEAKRYGAICLRKDLFHVSKPRKGDREFYLMDANEFQNLQALLGLMEESNLPYVKNACIYVFVESDAYMKIERQAKNMLEEKKHIFVGGELPLIVPVRSGRNLVQNLLNTVPLYEPLVNQPNRTDLKVTILGNGIIGTEAFLSTYWMGQMMVGQGKDMVLCDLTVNVVSKDTEEAFWSQIDYVNPEIRKTVAVYKNDGYVCDSRLLKVNEEGQVNAPYCKVRYTQLDLKSGGLWSDTQDQKEWLLDSDYYIVALGNDSDNVTIAEKLRCQIGKHHVEQYNDKKVGQVVIAYAVFDSALTEILNREKHFDSLGLGQTDIYMYAFGSLDQVYSCGNVYMSRNLMWQTQTGGAPSYDQFMHSHRAENRSRVAGELKNYENDNYNYWASLARAMHMKYRLFSLGWIGSSVFNYRTEEECAAWEKEIQEKLQQYRRFAVAKSNYPGYSLAQMQEFLGLSPEEMQDYQTLEQKREWLGWLEHRRWNAFTRSMGYQYVDVTKMLEPEKNRKDHKNMRLKLHSCLAEAAMPSAERGGSYMTGENMTPDLLDAVTLEKRKMNPSTTDYKVYDYYEREFSNFRFEKALAEELSAGGVENPELYCGHTLFADTFGCQSANGEAYLVPLDEVLALLTKDYRKLGKEEKADGEFTFRGERYVSRKQAAQAKDTVKN